MILNKEKLEKFKDGIKITLCGSTKFKKEYEELNKILTLQECVVYSVAAYGHADVHNFTVDQKEILDRVHKMKIDNSDAIFVLNVDDYIGTSTASEIEYARDNNKKVYYLSNYIIKE